MFVYLSENIIYSHIEQLSSLRSRALDVTQRFLKSLFRFGEGCRSDVLMFPSISTPKVNGGRCGGWGLEVGFIAIKVGGIARGRYGWEHRTSDLHT